MGTVLLLLAFCGQVEVREVTPELLRSRIENEMAHREHVVRLTQEAKRRAQEKAKIEQSMTRTWTDNTGAFSATAKFLDCQKGIVSLERLVQAKSVVVKLPASRLSKRDQLWVRQEMGRRIEEARKKKR